MPRATSASVNAPSSDASTAWKTTWNSRSPSSSSRCRVGAVGAVGALREAVDGLEHLVGLLEQVAGEASGGSAPGPTGTTPAASRPARRRRRPRPRSGAASCGIQSDVRWSALDLAVEVGPATSVIASSGQPEPLQHRHRCVVGDVGAELDVGQHPLVVDVRDEQRAPLPRRPGREAVAVDEPHARARAGSTPRRTHARSRKERAGRTSTSTRSLPGRPDEVVDRPLEHPGRAGHRVQHLALARPRRRAAPRRSGGTRRRRWRRSRRARRTRWRRRPPSRRGAASCGGSGRRSPRWRHACPR